MIFQRGCEVWSPEWKFRSNTQVWPLLLLGHYTGVDSYSDHLIFLQITHKVGRLSRVTGLWNLEYVMTWFKSQGNGKQTVKTLVEGIVRCKTKPLLGPTSTKHAITSLLIVVKFGWNWQVDKVGGSYLNYVYVFECVSHQWHQTTVLKYRKNKMFTHCCHWGIPT